MMLEINDLLILSVVGMLNAVASLDRDFKFSYRGKSDQSKSITSISFTWLSINKQLCHSQIHFGIKNAGIILLGVLDTSLSHSY